jgi:uncharacterized delta-60 repeat protein
MKEVICLKCLPKSGRQNQSRMRSLFRPTLFRTGLFICIAVLSVTGMTWAQAGQLDTTFATKGIFLLNSLGRQGGSTRVALQTDGKIVLAAPSGDPQQSNNGIALMRLNTNGTPDASFGTAGAVVFGVDHTVPVGVAIQPDGKILVGSAAGQNADGAGNALARFNSNGSVDNSFGTGGHVETLFLGIAGSAAIALQPDGKILMIGSNTLGRFDSNGQLDTSFGTGGVSALPFSGAAAIALQSDGKILIASSSQVLDFNRDGIIVRFNPNGTLDKTFGLFGQIGSVTSGGAFGPAGAAAVSSIVLQADGKFIVAGAITSKLINPPGANRTGFGLIRYNPNGSIDTSFGNAGGILTNFGSNPNATAFALAIQSNGDIIAAGQAGNADALNPFVVLPASLALSRYSSAGKLDTTFGSGGTVTTSLGSNASAISSLAIQSDGKIVAAGSIFSITNGQFEAQAAVARYLAQ